MCVGRTKAVNPGGVRMEQSHAFSYGVASAHANVLVSACVHFSSFFMTSVHKQFVYRMFIDIKDY